MLLDYIIRCFEEPWQYVMGTVEVSSDVEIVDSSLTCILGWKYQFVATLAVRIFPATLFKRLFILEISHQQYSQCAMIVRKNIGTR